MHARGVTVSSKLINLSVVFVRWLTAYVMLWAGLCSDASGGPHLPYISCFPAVTARLCKGDEVAVILASGELS